ncbi:hypothetical protein NMY22_g8087 [Coprinellus aureogranulatus]|nr:hypothetical protein NMY22_g8087 [Coprinellus aureogranulatus]
MSSRGQARSSLSEATLSAARSGSLTHLRQVYSALPQCYSLEVFQVFLDQLRRREDLEGTLDRPHHLESGEYPQEFLERLQAVNLSLDFVGRLPECLNAHPDLKDPTVRKTTNALHTIFLKLGYYLSILSPAFDNRNSAEKGANQIRGQQDFEVGDRPQLLSLCDSSIRILKAALDLGSKARRKLVRLDASIQVVTALWIMTVNGESIGQSSVKMPNDYRVNGETARARGIRLRQRGRGRALEATDGPGDLLLQVMRLIAKANRKGLVANLSRGVVCSLDTFLLQTMQRVRTASQHHSTRLSPLALADDATNFDHLVEITHFIMLDPQVREALFQHSVVKEFVTCITSIRANLLCDDGALDPPPHAFRKAITHWSCHVFEWSVHQSSSLLSNLSSLVRANMLQVIIDSFVVPVTGSKAYGDSRAHPPSGQLVSDLRTKYAPGIPPPHLPDACEEASYMLSVLISYASYPRILPALRRQVAAVPASALMIIPENDQRRILYQALEEEIKEGGEFLKIGDRIKICDNLDHKNTARPMIPCSGRQSKRPQTCSKCHSVVYCSRECQKRDWEQLHRYECSKAHLEYTHSEESYSHPTRAFQLSVLLEAFGKCYHSQKPGTTSRPNDSRAFNEFKLLPSSAHSRHAPAWEALGIRCFDLTAKKEGCIFRPYLNWKVEAGGKYIPKWKSRRWAAMKALWGASHFAYVLRATRPDASASAALSQPERYITDAQFLYGNRVLHLVALLRRGNGPRQLGDRSCEFAVEGSFFFFEQMNPSTRAAQVARQTFALLSAVSATTFNRVTRIASRGFKSTTPGTWVSLLLLMFAAWLLNNVI